MKAQMKKEMRRGYEGDDQFGYNGNFKKMNMEMKYGSKGENVSEDKCNNECKLAPSWLTF